MHRVIDDNTNLYRNIVMDAMKMNQSYIGQFSIIDEEPNIDTIRFFDLLKNSDEPLWDGCTNHIKLSVVAHVFTIKSDLGWVRPVMTELLNRQEALYLKGIRWKINFMQSPSTQDTRKLTCVQTSACYTTLKIQSWLSVEHVDMLIINPKLVGK